jgi:CrcB protein
MSRALPYLLVGAGGFAGAIARFLAGQWMSGLVASRFPFATFFINVSGSFLLGVVAAMTAARAFANSDAVALAAGVGFLGAYTTFSTFELETHALLQDRLSLTASAYVIGSFVVGLFAVRAGIAAARAWLI